MMAVPIFTLNLNQKLLPGRVTIGKYDGTHSCLTAATTADMVQDCVSFFYFFQVLVLFCWLFKALLCFVIRECTFFFFCVLLEQ